MAKVKLPSWLLEVAGSLDKMDLTFRRFRGRQILETLPAPSYTRSEKQDQQRNKFTQAVKLWHSMTDEEKEAYREIARELGITPYNAFLREKLKAEEVGIWYKVTINNTGSALTDYQILLNISGDSTFFDDCESKKEAIRVYDEDKTTALSYWIEEWDTENNNAKIWIKIPSILGSSTKTIYISVDPSRTTDEGTTDIFDVYEDFTGADGTDPEGWTDVANIWSISSNQYYASADYDMGQAYVTDSNIKNMVIEAKLRQTGSGYTALMFRRQSNGACYWLAIRYWSSDASKCRIECFYWSGSSNTNLGLLGNNVIDTNYHKLTVKVYENTAKVYLDDTYMGDIDLSTHITASGQVGVTTWDAGGHYVDDFIVRKYADPEPTWSSFGSWTALFQAFETTLTDTISLSSSIQKLPSIIYFDIVVTSDDFSTFKQKGKALVELVSLIEQLAKRISIVRKDDISPQESIGFRIPLSLLVSLSIVDLFSHIRRRQKLLSSTITLADSLSLGLIKYLIESLLLSDLLSLLPKLFGNLKVDTKNHSFAVWCSGWKEDNYSIVIELIADKDSRDKLISDIVPGAVAQLYNILGEPKFIDTTYEGKNTITLTPRRGLSTLKDPVTVAVKRYAETMLRWDLFKIKLEVVRL